MDEDQNAEKADLSESQLQISEPDIPSNQPGKTSSKSGDATEDILVQFKSQLCQAAGLVDKMSPSERDVALGQLHSLLQQKQLTSPGNTIKFQKPGHVSSEIYQKTPDTCTPVTTKRGRGRPRKNFSTPKNKGENNPASRGLRKTGSGTSDEASPEFRRSARAKKPSYKVRDREEDDGMSCSNKPDPDISKDNAFVTATDRKQSCEQESKPITTPRRRGRPPKVKKLKNTKEDDKRTISYDKDGESSKMEVPLVVKVEQCNEEQLLREVMSTAETEKKCYPQSSAETKPSKIIYIRPQTGQLNALEKSPLTYNKNPNGSPSVLDILKQDVAHNVQSKNGEANQLTQDDFTITYLPGQSSDEETTTQENYLCEICAGCYETKQLLDEHSCKTSQIPVNLVPQSDSEEKMHSQEELSNNDHNSKNLSGLVAILPPTSSGIINNSNKITIRQIRSNSISKTSTESEKSSIKLEVSDNSKSLLNIQTKTSSSKNKIIIPKTEHNDQDDHVSDNDEPKRVKASADVQNYILKVDGKFRCKECGKEALHRNNLVTHVRIHTGTKPYSCNLCTKTFKTSSNMQRHVRETHEKQRPKICENCGKGFFTQKSLMNHIQKHHNTEENGSNITIFTCKDCGKQFNRKSSLRCHMNVHSEPSRNSCPQCGKTFRFASNLRRHLKVHRDERPHKCPHCDKRFIEPRSLRLHQKIKHDGLAPTRNLKYPCDICNRAFANISTLKIHSLSHNGLKPHLCTTCGKQFSLKTNLKRHLATHSGERPFACSHCPKRYSSKKNLLIHIMAHNDEFPYICSTCGKGFTTAHSLTEHMPTHHRQRAFSCTECKQTFLRQSHLQYHMRQHKNSPHLTCDHCTSKFYRRTDLKRHMLKHTGEKPFKCMLCPRAFSRHHYLKEHLKSHAALYIRCSVCNKVYAGAIAYHQHVNTDHKNLTAKRPVILLPTSGSSQNNLPIDIKINIKNEPTTQSKFIVIPENVDEQSMIQAKIDERNRVYPRQLYSKSEALLPHRPQGEKDPLRQAMSVIFDSEEEFVQKVEVADSGPSTSAHIPLQPIGGDVSKFYDPNTFEEVSIQNSSISSSTDNPTQLVSLLATRDLPGTALPQYDIHQQTSSEQELEVGSDNGQGIEEGVTVMASNSPVTLEQDSADIQVPIDVNEPVNNETDVSTAVQQPVQSNPVALMNSLSNTLTVTEGQSVVTGNITEINQSKDENYQVMPSGSSMINLNIPQEHNQIVLEGNETLVTSNAEPTIVETIGQNGERQHYVIMPDGTQVRLMLDDLPNSSATGTQEIKVVIEGQDEPQYLFIVNNP